MTEQTELILKELRKLNDLCSRFAALADVLTHGFEPEPIYEWQFLQRGTTFGNWTKVTLHCTEEEIEESTHMHHITKYAPFVYEKIESSKRERK